MKSNKLKSFCLFFVWSVVGFTVFSCSNAQSDPQAVSVSTKIIKEKAASKSPVAVNDTAAYRKKINAMLNGDSSDKWKFKGDFPLAGAWLPHHRIIAYYGNLYSTRMGILGELPKPQMFAKLKGELDIWRKADPSTPVKPALHYIVTTAQGSPGAGGKYRLRMPNKEIDKVRGQRPGTVIGTFDAGDINYASQYLKDLVQKYSLPPKMLVIHRFTQNMVREYKSIKKHPEVQIIVDMDGWGAPARKINTYKQFVYAEPIQFTGFKLFYKNDLKEPPHRMLTPSELLKLKPVPMYIQYQ